MTSEIDLLAFSVDGLRRDADEIEGWGAGNEASQVRWAANEIDRLRKELAEARQEVEDAKHDIERLMAINSETLSELAEARNKALDDAQEAVRQAWDGYGVSLVRINDAIRNLKDTTNEQA